MFLQESFFLRKYCIYKTTDLKSKSIDFFNIDLPKKSSLHVLDNLDVNNNRYIDFFRIDSYPFIKSNIEYNYLINNLTLDIELIKNLKNTRFIFKTNNLRSNLQRNMSNNRLKSIGFTNIKKHLSKLLNKDNIIILVNHNPIISRLQLRVTNKKYENYYLSLIYMNSIMNWIKNNIENRNNIIFIPLNNKTIIPTKVIRNLFNNNKIPDNYLHIFNSKLFYILAYFIMTYSNKDNKTIDYNFIHIDRNLFYSFINLDTKKGIIFNSELLLDIINYDFQKLVKIIHLIQSISLEMNVEKIESIANNIDENEYISSKDNINNKISFNKPIENPIDYSTISNTKTNIIDKITYKKYSDTILNDFQSLLKEINYLTFNQKNRYLNMVKDALNSEITIDNKTFKIKDIIENPPDYNIKDIIDVSDKIDPDVMDVSAAKNNVININKEYMDKLFIYDFCRVILSFAKNGLIFKKYNENTIKDDLNLYKQLEITFTNIDGKTKTLKMKIPLLDKEGHFRYNGVKSIMGLQLVNSPIVKLDNYRVSLSSNYGKTIVERNKSLNYNFANQILKLIEKFNKEYNNIIKFSKHIYHYKSEISYDYTSIGKIINYINNGKFYLSFKYNQRLDILGKKNGILSENQLNDLESKYGILFGYDLNNKNQVLFINKDNIVKLYNITLDRIIDEGFIIDYIFPFDDFNINLKPEWINVLILDKRLPLIFILGYKYGLSYILQELNIPYRLVKKGKQLNLSKYEIPIKFKDLTLIIPRYPITKSWILCGLQRFNLSSIDFKDLDINDTYYNLISSIGLSINYLKGIDNIFNFFIDPITEDILKEMNEPTTLKELFYRAVEILKTEYHDEPSSIKNFRIKGLEKINGIIYNEIARQYAQYLNDKSKNTSFTINTESIIMNILQDRSVRLVEETNPVQYLKEKTLITHGGFLGRELEAFVYKDQRYPSDGLGLISEAVPDSNKAGFNAYTSINTRIKNLRGMINHDVDIDKLQAGNILSVGGNLMQFSINDDAKRLAFISIQLAHHVPSLYAEPCRVRTGFESILPYYTGDLYCVRALDNGKVIEISDNYFKVKYNKLGEYLYYYGKIEGIVSSFLIEHSIILNDLKENKTFKKNDILAYNEGFFKLDPITNTLNWCHGIKANLAIADVNTTLEDGSGFTKEFLKKSEFNVIHRRVIKISNEFIISDMKQEGDIVDYEDPLLILEYQDISDLLDIDEDLDEEEDILQSLNKIIPKAKYKGKIHKIKIYHTSNIEDYHPSIQKILKNYYRKINKLKKNNKNVINLEDVNINPKVEPGTRIKKSEIDYNELIIDFYISSSISADIGDKFVIDNSLKTIVGEIIDYDIKSKSGIPIDGIFGRDSIFNRIITSPIKVGLLERILESIENNVIKMIENE